MIGLIRSVAGIQDNLSYSIGFKIAPLDADFWANLRADIICVILCRINMRYQVTSTSRRSTGCSALPVAYELIFFFWIDACVAWQTVHVLEERAPFSWAPFYPSTIILSFFEVESSAHFWTLKKNLLNGASSSRSQFASSVTHPSSYRSAV